MPYLPDPRYAFHPYVPERLGYRALLRVAKPRLATLLRTTDDYTLVSGRNRTTLYREGCDVLRRDVPGDFMEIGVHRGGSAGVLAHLIKERPERELHLFDRWGDLPEPTEQDGYRQEQYRKDRIPEKLARLRDDPPLEATRHLIENVIDFPAERIRYYAGWYNETFPEYSGRPIAFASIDCDYYESVRDALAFTIQYASPGAVIIVDDYGAWPGAKTAVHEWLDSAPGKASLQTVNTGPAILRLPA